MKWGIIVKIWVVIGGKKRIIGGRRGIIGTNSADRAPTDECSVDAVGMHIIIYIATGDGRGVTEMLPEMALIIISRYDFTISGLDLCVAECEIVVSFPKICLIVERKRIGMAAKFGMGGKRMTQKAVASSDGFAIVAVAPMAAGKQVFLGAIITTPTVMQSMTSEDTTNKKRPTAVKKVRLAPVQKQLPRKFPSTRADNMETTINTRQVMGMVGVGMGMVGRVRRDGWDGHWDDRDGHGDGWDGHWDDWDGHGNGWDGHGDDWDGSHCRNCPTQRQLCRSCVFIAQGCGRSSLPWVAAQLL